MFACEAGNSLAVNFLLRHKAQVNLKDNAGQSAIMITCQNWTSSSLELFNQLVKGGALIDAQDHIGRTALIKACEEGHTVTVQLLLNNAARVNVQDNEGHTALMRACRKGHYRNCAVTPKQCIWSTR